SSTTTTRASSGRRRSRPTARWSCRSPPTRSCETAERLAAELEAAGVDTLLDDRDERPGVKFKDADLIGLPVRLTVGPRALARGAVELKRRSDREATEVPVAEAAARAAALVGPRGTAVS